MRKYILLIFILLLFSYSYSYIKISPTVIFINEPRKSSSLEIFNSSDNEVEVSFEIKYGYIASDDSNRLILLTPENLNADDRSAASWISTYPSKIILKPLEKRMVRIIASPPDNLADGEYWSRVVVISKRLDKKIKTSENKERARIGFEIQNQQSIPFHYRKGKVSTSIELIGNPVLKIEKNNLSFLVNLRRFGNSSFWGMLNFSLTDSKGKLIKKDWKHFVVYKEIKHNFVVDVKDVPKGDYVLNVLAETKRFDDAAKSVINAEPKNWKYNIRIQ